MKRAGFLIDRVADIDNLRLALWKACKGKEAKNEVFNYCNYPDKNLLFLRNQILAGKVEVGNYNTFTIFDPKKRQICAAPFAQRVLHHALMNVCDPYFERKQIFDSYACRKGKGSYAALQRASVFTKKYQWFLKFDVIKYFDSVSHNILKIQLQQLFKDEKLLRILFSIIDSYEIESGKGLPIGNLTSQYFANHFLSAADHLVKEQLKTPAYVRYMDDMVLWHNDKKELIEAGRKFQQFINQQLVVQLKPPCLNKNTRGLPFLGYLIFKNKINLAYRSRKRFIKKLNEYEMNLEEEKYSQAQYQQHVLPLLAFTRYADAKGFRQKVINSLA